ncbi:trypsin-like peptidase domain-containing protein [Streptomyces sp. NPDC002187]|uniref:trypsin-like peptidase domain-containing protein n=1 Tax=Streptomyces sp. NPDC002187 TaxID=3364637 RepID=UPI003688C476
MGSGDLAALVRICDPAGRPRGTGFVADRLGTVVTSHEAVDGQARVMLYASGGRVCSAEGDAVTELPHHGLALLRADGLGVPPLPIGTRDGTEPGRYVRLAAHGWREARVLGTTRATYAAAGSRHAIDDALELAIGTDGSDALRLGGAAAGGPVLDARTGAVLGILGTALRCGHATAACAVPLRAAGRAPGGPLAALLRRNGTTVPAYGGDLNLAAVLELTAARDAHGPRIERPGVARQLDDFADGATALVAALAGAPGTGRTTELTALASRRAPAPTLRVRGADLRADDTSIADAAARVLAASGPAAMTAGITPDRVAGLAREAGHTLLIVLDGPEEAPPQPPDATSRWTANTVAWLTATDTRLIIGCRPEHWEAAGTLYPPGVLYGSGAGAPRVRVPERRAVLRASGAVHVRPRTALPDAALFPAGVHRVAVVAGDGAGAVEAVRAGDAAGETDGDDRLRLPELRSGGHTGSSGAPGQWFDTAQGRAGRPEAGPGKPPPAVPIGEFTPDEARRIRELCRVPDAMLAGADALHPLALRIYGEVRDAPGADMPARPVRADLFGAYLDLVCLRIAAGAAGDVPGSAVRRLAASLAGHVHEMARRCLATGQGDLDRASFEELFSGWESAVLAEGLIVAAGPGYRFAHEEVAEWVLGAHLDVDATLDRLVHRPQPGAGQPVPRHRLGIVVHALLRLDPLHGPAALERRLTGLARALEQPRAVSGDARWWARRLLGEVLRRVPDAEPYADLLLRLVRLRDPDAFGPGFWERLPLREATRLDLLRRLVPDDPPHGDRSGRGGGRRYLDVAAARLAADPGAVQPLLCRWFADTTPLPAGPDATVRPTVAMAAQALLYARRGLAVDDLTEALVDAAHPRAAELLAALAEDEPSALCRAVARWARDPRPQRRGAAAAHAPATAAAATRPADHELLRQAALALLDGLPDPAVRVPALMLLVRDPVSRPHHLDAALAAYTAGAPGLSARALAPALADHPGPVLAAFRARLLTPPGDRRADDADEGGEILGVLAGITAPAPARRAAALVCEYVDHRPHAARQAAVYVERLLERGPGARDLLFPLVTRLLRGRPPQVRAALAPVLAAPCGATSRPLRAELLDVLLEYEQYEARDLAVLEAVLSAAALGCTVRTEPRTRELVHRTGLLLARSPGGAARLDRRLVELAHELPGFAASLTGWLATAPQEWAAVVGPGTRRALVPLACPVPMPTARRGHGSLRPAQEAIMDTGSGEERSQCSAGVAWRTSPRTGDAASSPSAPTTGCTAGTS